MKLTKGPFLLAIETIAFPVLLFFVTPLLIDAIGVNNYGTWSYIQAIVSMGSIFSFGTSVAIIGLLSSEISENSGRAEILKVSAMQIGFFQGVFLSCIVAAFVFSVSSNGYFGSIEYQVFLIYGSVLAITEQVDSAITAVVRAAQKFGATITIDIVSRIFQLLFSVVFAKFFGFEWMLIAYAIGAVVRIFLKYNSASIVIPGGLSFFGNSDILEVARKARVAWVQGILGGVMLFADRIVAGNIIGPHAAGAINALSLIPQQLHAVATAAISYIYPRFVQKRSLGEHYWNSARTEVLKITSVLFAVMLICYVLLIFFSDYLLNSWLGGRLGGEKVSGLFLIITLAYFLQVLNAPSYFLLTSYGFSGLLTKLMSFSGVFSLILIVPLTNYFGIEGAVGSKVIYGLLSLSMVIAAWMKNHVKTIK